MYIRRAFTVFLDVQSEASPVVTAAVTDWTLDWRWFCEPTDAVLPSERPFIDWRAWARPRTPRPRP
jgi:hypothetical protein